MEYPPPHNPNYVNSYGGQQAYYPPNPVPQRMPPQQYVPQPMPSPCIQQQPQPPPMSSLDMSPALQPGYYSPAATPKRRGADLYWNARVGFFDNFWSTFGKKCPRQFVIKEKRRCGHGQRITTYFINST